MPARSPRAGRGEQRGCARGAGERRAAQGRSRNARPPASSPVRSSARPRGEGRPGPAVPRGHPEPVGIRPVGWPGGCGARRPAEGFGWEAAGPPTGAFPSGGSSAWCRAGPAAYLFRPRNERGGSGRPRPAFVLLFMFSHSHYYHVVLCNLPWKGRKTSAYRRQSRWLCLHNQLAAVLWNAMGAS